jgi:hypothetical protein
MKVEESSSGFRRRADQHPVTFQQLPRLRLAGLTVIGHGSEAARIAAAACAVISSGQALQATGLGREPSCAFDPAKHRQVGAELQHIAPRREETGPHHAVETLKADRRYGTGIAGPGLGRGRQGDVGVAFGTGLNSNPPVVERSPSWVPLQNES